MSDFGERDHYVAAVKARILTLNPNANIVDITHRIDQFNIPHAAFVLKSVFRDFPKGTVHLVSVNSPSREPDKLIAIKLEEHYFVGTDCGIFPLLSDKEPSVIVELRPDPSFSPVFPDRSTLAVAAVSLASAGNIYNLGVQLKSIKKMLNRQLKVTRDQISGHVVHVDHYGNLLTNIPRGIFEEVRNNRNYIIHFGVETLDQVMESYQGVENGDCMALFNSNGVLEIAISQGNASELLGIAFDSPVTISFNG